MKRILDIKHISEVTETLAHKLENCNSDKDYKNIIRFDENQFDSDDSKDFSEKDLEDLKNINKMNVTIFETDKLKELDKQLNANENE